MTPTVSRIDTTYELVANFTTPGEPVSKARARFTGYGGKSRAFTPEKTKTAEQLVAWKFREAVKGHQADDQFTYGIRAMFYAGTRQRRDVDNMLKLVLDGLNGVAWADDVQVSEVHGCKVFVTPAEARTEILVFRTGKVSRPQAQCQHCGGNFDTYTSWNNKKKFCSPECRSASRAAAKLRTCKSCGVKFTSHHVEQVPMYCSVGCKSAAGRVERTCTTCGTQYSVARSSMRKGIPACSQECRDTYWRQQRARAAKGTCVDCAGPTSRKEYERCRGCGIKHRRGEGTAT